MGSRENPRKQLEIKYIAKLTGMPHNLVYWYYKSLPNWIVESHSLFLEEEGMNVVRQVYLKGLCLIKSDASLSDMIRSVYNNIHWDERRSVLDNSKSRVSILGFSKHDEGAIQKQIYVICRDMFPDIECLSYEDVSKVFVARLSAMENMKNKQADRMLLAQLVLSLLPFSKEKLCSRTHGNRGSRKVKTVNFMSPSRVLFVHMGHIMCQREKHPIICATAKVGVRNDCTAELNVNYCSECDQYFISYQTLQYYKQLYGMVVANVCVAEDGCFTTCEFPRAKYSPLFLCGYNTRQDGLDDYQRQQLLKKLIDAKIMPKDRIITYLESFINTNGQRDIFELALEKWESDLEFVRSYGMEDQIKVAITGIET